MKKSLSVFRHKIRVSVSVPAEGCSKQPFELSYSYLILVFFFFASLASLRFNFFPRRGCMDL